MDTNEKLAKYEFPPVENGRAVTALIDTLEPEFDRMGHSQRAAQRLQTTQAAILRDWDAKRDKGKELGTVMHDYIAEVLSGKLPDPIEGLSDKQGSMRQFDKFWQGASDHFSVIWIEKPISSDHFQITGRIDALLFNPSTGKYHIIDWKRGVFKPKGYDPLAPPFADLLNSAPNLGALQTSIYRLTIENHTEIELGESYLIYLSDYTYTVKMMDDYRNRVEPWLLKGTKHDKR